MKAGIFTTEFWISAAGMVGNVVLVLVILGVIHKEDQQSWTMTLTEFVTALGTVVINGAVIWRYISSRELLKAEYLKASSPNGNGNGHSLPPVE